MVAPVTGCLSGAFVRAFVPAIMPNDGTIKGTGRPLQPSGTAGVWVEASGLVATARARRAKGVACRCFDDSSMTLTRLSLRSWLPSSLQKNPAVAFGNNLAGHCRIKLTHVMSNLSTGLRDRLERGGSGGRD